MRLTLLAAAAAALLTTSLGAQEHQGADLTTWKWDGAVPAGQWLTIRNVNGPVTVTASPDGQAHVTAEKHWDRGDPKDVSFTVVQGSSGTTICALWHDDDECDENGYHSHNHHDRRGNDVEVRFTVQLPKGAKIGAHSVNDDVRVEGATAEVQASSVNGAVDVATTHGPVQASSVNGDLNIRMDDAGSGDMHFSTVNGSILLKLPANIAADVDFSTVNGGVSTDFPLQVSGRMSPRHIRATIGGGGRKITATTVNGGLELRKLP